MLPFIYAKQLMDYCTLIELELYNISIENKEIRKTLGKLFLANTGDELVY